MDTRIGVRNVSFSGNLACFIFSKHLFWDSPFCLITDALTFIKREYLSEVIFSKTVSLCHLPPFSMYLFMVRDRLQASLSELINFCSPWNQSENLWFRCEILRRSLTCFVDFCSLFFLIYDEVFLAQPEGIKYLVLPFIDLKMESHILYTEEAHLCGYVTPEEYPGDFWEGWVKFFISCVAAPRPSLVHWLGAPLTRCSSLRKLNYNLRVGGYFVRRLVAKVWLSTSVFFRTSNLQFRV